MRIAFISIPTRLSSRIMVPPYGIMYIASYLRNKGNVVTIIDIARTRQDDSVTIDELHKFKPDVIGISGIITAYGFIKALIPVIKKNFPDIPIIVGGHVALDMDDLLLNAGCDYVMTGYGEIKFEYLLESMNGSRHLNEIDGLSYVENESIIRVKNTGFPKFKADDIPFPAYDLIDMDYYSFKGEQDAYLLKYLSSTGKVLDANKQSLPFVVFGARGCTDKCSFCVHEFSPFRGLHVHSVDYVLDNIRFLHENYGIYVFSIGEEMYFFNNKQASEFTERMTRELPDVFWKCVTRSDRVNEELIEILKNSNCYDLCFAVESGSDHMLDLLWKGTNRETMLKGRRLINELYPYSATTLIVGGPGETKKTIADTIDFIRKTNIYDAGIFYTTPYPGSRLFQWAIENSYIKDKEKYLLDVANRDACVLSINFTPYPDIVVKMMYVMVQNALIKNARKVGMKSYRSAKERVLKEYLVPVMYECYFAGRKLASVFIKKYREDTVPIKYHKSGTIALVTDEG